MKKALRIVAVAWEGIPSAVDRLGLPLAVGLLLFGIFSLVFGPDDPEASRVGKVLELLDRNWKAVLLVLSPLFFTTMREVVERITALSVGQVQVTLAQQVRRPGPAQQED